MKDKNSFFIKGFMQSAIITIISRISGFIRDIFIAALLGAGIFSDIFFIAYKLPNLFRRVTAEGALTSAVVPIYSKLREQKKLLAYKYLKSLIWKLAILLSFVVIFLQIIMPFIVYFLAPGFVDDSDTINQITVMTRITIFFMPLVSVVALLGVATNVSGKFWALSFTPIILNLCLIIGCFFIDNNLIIRSLPLAVAIVFAGILELLFMMLIIRKFNIMKIKKTKGNEDDFGNQNKIKFYLKKTWVKFLPAAFGAGILQLNLLVDTILASLLGFGSVSFLYFADRIAQLPLGIIGIALGSVLLTSLSKEYAKKDKKKFSNNLIMSLKIGLFFSIPTAIAFISFSELFIRVLFERGEFTSQETIQTSHALFAYSVGIPAFIMLKSCQPAFFAEGNTKTPLYIGIILLVLNIFLSIILMHYWDHAGIALATSIASWIGVVIYIFLLIKGGKILKPINNQSNKYLSYNSLLIYFFKILMVSLLMLVTMKLVFYGSSVYQINEIFTLSFVVISGLLIYVLTTFILGYIPQELLNFYISKFEKAK